MQIDHPLTQTVVSILRFFAGFGLIVLLITTVIPAICHSAPFAELTDFAKERELNTSGLFYTDVDETGQADIDIRDNRDY